MTLDCGDLLWVVDDADAVFNESAISQPMQDIHHLVMTTDKRLKNPGCVRDVQIEGSYNVCPALRVGDTLNIIARENHRHRAPREVVGNLFATELHEKVPDCALGFAVAIASAIAIVSVVFFVSPLTGKIFVVLYEPSLRSTPDKPRAGPFTTGLYGPDSRMLKGLAGCPCG